MVTQTRIKFADRVRELRRKQGLSQEELADRANLHHTYIGAIERAEQNVSIDNIHHIAKALHVKVRDLFD
jgi:transcriptional regulator with XRE-family HTH domain